MGSHLVLTKGAPRSVARELDRYGFPITCWNCKPGKGRRATGRRTSVPVQISLTAIILPKNHDNLSSSIEKRRTRGSFCLAGSEQCHSSASTTVLSKYLTFALGEAS